MYPPVSDAVATEAPAASLTGGLAGGLTEGLTGGPAEGSATGAATGAAGAATGAAAAAATGASGNVAVANGTMAAAVSSFTPQPPPMAPGWQQLFTPQGTPYYYNQALNLTQWQAPQAPQPPQPVGGGFAGFSLTRR